MQQQQIEMHPPVAYTDAQTVAWIAAHWNEYYTVPITVTRAGDWRDMYRWRRWGHLPVGETPYTNEQNLASALAFVSLPFATPQDPVRLDQILYIEVHNTVTQYPQAALHALDVSVVHRVLAFAERLRREGVPSANVEGWFTLPDTELSAPYSDDTVHILQQELYRRDVAAYARYTRSGAPRTLDHRLPAGLYSSLQYLVASFLATPIQRDPSGLYGRPQHPEHYPQVLPPVQSFPARMPIDLHAAEMRHALWRQRQAEAAAAAGDKRKGGGAGDDHPSNRPRKDDEKA